jgi:hypothetical protein
MTARELFAQVEGALARGEDADDVVAMIQLLADSRARARRTSPEEELNWAAKIICIIFDPLKPPSYQRTATEARLAFTGIAGDERLRRLFAGRIERVAMVGDLHAVIAHGRFLLPTGTETTRSSTIARTRLVVDGVASAYEIDAEKLVRLYESMRTVLRRRLQLRPPDIERVLQTVFARCAEEREHILNPHGWLLDTTFALGEQVRSQPIIAPESSLEDLFRDDEDDNRRLELDAE